MSRSIVYGVIAALVSILCPFFFPWQFTVAISIFATFFFPPAAVLSGLLLDILYSTTKTVPYFTIVGVAISSISYIVQQFVKTRIMS